MAVPSSSTHTIQIHSNRVQIDEDLQSLSDQNIPSDFLEKIIKVAIASTPANDDQIWIKVASELSHDGCILSLDLSFGPETRQNKQDLAPESAPALPLSSRSNFYDLQETVSPFALAEDNYSQSCSVFGNRKSFLTASLIVQELYLSGETLNASTIASRIHIGKERIKDLSGRLKTLGVVVQDSSQTGLALSEQGEQDWMQGKFEIAHPSVDASVSQIHHAITAAERGNRSVQLLPVIVEIAANNFPETTLDAMQIFNAIAAKPRPYSPPVSQVALLNALSYLHVFGYIEIISKNEHATKVAPRPNTILACQRLAQANP